MTTRRDALKGMLAVLLAPLGVKVAREIRIAPSSGKALAGSFGGATSGRALMSISDPNALRMDDVGYETRIWKRAEVEREFGAPRSSENTFPLYAFEEDAPSRARLYAEYRSLLGDVS